MGTKFQDGLRSHGHRRWLQPRGVNAQPLPPASGRLLPLLWKGSGEEKQAGIVEHASCAQGKDLSESRSL